MTIITGLFKCLDCKYVFEHSWTVGNLDEICGTTCYNCGHLYVKWLNYDELFGKKTKKKNSNV